MSEGEGRTIMSVEHVCKTVNGHFFRLMWPNVSFFSTVGIFCIAFETRYFDDNVIEARLVRDVIWFENS